MPEIIHGLPTKYGWRVLYPENLKLGKYTDLAAGVLINAQYGVEIGKYTQIGPYVCILSSNTINDVFGVIKIGKNCRIGAFSLILPNVIIPENSFIKAYSVIK